VWFRGLPRTTVWLQPVIGGVAVGLMGWFMPEVLGVGYDYVERVLGGDVTLRAVALLAIMKIIATALSYSSGNAGGIFGPSLFIGAMMGGSVGAVAHAWFPHQTAGPGAYALIGMGTAFAGIVRTPLTSVIMVFEMTRDYSIIVPLMISNLISFLVSYQLQREPIYEALAHQEGVQLPSGESREQLKRLQAGAYMQPADRAFPMALPVEEARRRITEWHLNSWPIAQDGFVKGVVKLERLDGAMEAGRSPVSGSLQAEKYAFIYRDQSLSLALERMGQAGVDALPVVSRADRNELLGVLTLPDVLTAYGVMAQSEGEA
jgi:CIC family chloride channel protein